MYIFAYVERSADSVHVVIYHTNSYFQQQKFQIALDLINKLLREIKKLDDKQLLVEIHLVESKLHHALRNVPKAKAALTAARSISNAIYVIPKTQAQIDEMSGILHAEEHDYKTAYSYFFESFEALATIDEVEALSCLKYMLLSKIASGGASDVNNIVNSKQAIKFVGIDVEALKAVAKAHEQRSLQMFEEATKKYAARMFFRACRSERLLFGLCVLMGLVFVCVLLQNWSKIR